MAAPMTPLPPVTNARFFTFTVPPPARYDWLFRHYLAPVIIFPNAREQLERSK